MSAPTAHRETRGDTTADLLRSNAVALVSTVLAVALAAVVLFVLPQEREVRSLGIFIFKLLPFVFAATAIATVDRAVIDRFAVKALLLVAAYLGFFLYLVPKITFNRESFEDLYAILLITAPYVILTLVLAYRLGGGPPGKTFRLAIALLLLMISGLEDLAYFTVNDDPSWPDPFPETWDWVSHITVRIGRAPTREDIIVVASLHVVAALAVLFLPFDRMWRALRRRVGLDRDAAAADADEPVGSA
ncbi:hypothetical protein [Euzebya tangerina]|uniref:hypothetical protein n=1 Tax=Euzebya tangerina TaxID=591198 RepID=UPI000E3248A6|nr:hypothetical protein [Euzebya tangerina]